MNDLIKRKIRNFLWGSSSGGLGKIRRTLNDIREPTAVEKAYYSLKQESRPRTGYRMPNNIQWVEEMVEEYGESRFLRALEELEK